MICQYCDRKIPTKGSCCMWNHFDTDDLSNISEHDQEIALFECKGKKHYSTKLGILDDGSNSFVTSLAIQYDKNKTLSEKQIECIDKMYKEFKHKKSK